MQWMNTSRASLAVSGVALFVALGGTAMAVTKIGTSELRNGAVTRSKLRKGAVTAGKLHQGAVTAGKLGPGAVTSAALGAAAVSTGALANGAVSNGKLADNAVTSAKVADGSLTASDVAPGTFLAAGGTAANASALGGVPAAGFVQGGGQWVSNRVVVPIGQTKTLLELNFAHIDAVCQAGAVPVQRFVAELKTENVFFTTTSFGVPAPSEISSSNSLAPGGFLEAAHTSTNPQSVIWQGAYNDGSEHIATAWTTEQAVTGSCVFMGQAETSLG
jgi:hypothetical protein